MKIIIAIVVSYLIAELNERIQEWKEKKKR